MAWYFESGRAIYVQIVEHIVTDILSGTYAMGERLPSVRELAVDAAVNPNTMQKALAELENLGLATSQRNSGRFVTADESVLFRAKNSMAERYAEEYLRKMGALGYDKYRAAELVTNFGNGVVEHGNNS